MCLDFPGRVIAHDGERVVVETGGRLRGASTLLHPDVAVGDWVLVAAGTVVERLAEADARQISQEIEAARGGIS